MRKPTMECPECGSDDTIFEPKDDVERGPIGRLIGKILSLGAPSGPPMGDWALTCGKCGHKSILKMN
jgi:DNA-directed RNA polymerase subunit RPC12/RpoP